MLVDGAEWMLLALLPAWRAGVVRAERFPGRGMQGDLIVDGRAMTTGTTSFYQSSKPCLTFFFFFTMFDEATKRGRLDMRKSDIYPFSAFDLYYHYRQDLQTK